MAVKKKEVRRHFKNNPMLKQVGEQIEFTMDDVQEIQKCKTDILYFIETYCKIITLDHGLAPFKMHPFQREMVKLVQNNKRVLAKIMRQGGKTSIAAGIFLWYSIFNDDYTIAIMAHNKAAAREVLDRYQTMYENLPKWLQLGVRTWNKGDIELENGSKVFTSATTKAGIRGRSVRFAA